ncbi:unnamed protein product [Cylindrotheca closterium]|uniref:Cyclin N-terminal domain-containing protein n=1 Tax=Cylindrotheca closterium TaxID=2856 RepID=A0AAD2CKU3_9STRA|nr:unnamed protein product [Cylindrotheca closterium]
MPSYSLLSKTQTLSLSSPSSSSNALFTADAVDELGVLFQQEQQRQERSSPYETTDYLTTQKCQLTVAQEEYEQHYPTTQEESNNLYSSYSSPKAGERECGNNQMLIQWRQASCIWAFQVAKFFGLNREIVTIGMNHLDRYLAFVLSSENTTATIATTTTTTTMSKAIPATIKTTIITKQDFQLWVLTSLYLAIKLNHGCCGCNDRLVLPGGGGGGCDGDGDGDGGTNNNNSTTLETICQLSDPDPFGPEQLQQMELAMLQALNWHVHPPTPQAVLRLLWHPMVSQKLLSLVHLHLAQNKTFLQKLAQWWHDKVYSRACVILDEALKEYESLSYSCSEMAIAALLNVMDFCNFGNATSLHEEKTNTNSFSSIDPPSTLLLSLWKQDLPTEFGEKFSSVSLNACRRHLEQYFDEEELVVSGTKRRKHSDDGALGDTIVNDAENPDLKGGSSSAPKATQGSCPSPPVPKKARLRVIPSPACIRDPILM